MSSKLLLKLLCKNNKANSTQTWGRSTTATAKKDSGYPYDGHVDKNPYPHDRRADKDSYSHDSNNQCIILRLQLSFVIINVQLMLV